MELVLVVAAYEHSSMARTNYFLKVNVLKFLNTFFLFAYKMLVYRAGNNKMLNRSSLI